MTARAHAALIATVVLAAACGARAQVRDAGDAVRVVTSVDADTVTVGERFNVTYQFAYADTLTLVEPIQLSPGTCRLLESRRERARGGAAGRDGVAARFIPASIDSVLVPEQAFLFVTGHGDTLRAWSDPVDLPLRYLSLESQDLRPLKEQWTMPPNWLLWISLGVAALALAAALVWWLRRRRARRPAAAVPRVVIPPELEALAALERIEGMGLVARGEMKTFYTLVVDVVRRYLEARYGVEAMDRTTHELLGDLARRGHEIEGLAGLLEEADLVKFAKYRPDATHAEVAMSRARDVVVSTTRRVVNAPGQN